MATPNIYSTEWLNVVFSARNKEYGAYVLRTDNSKSTLKALFFGSSFFILAIIVPAIARHFSMHSVIDRSIDTQYDFKKLELDQPKAPVIQPSEAPKPRVNQIKFPPPVAVTNPKTVDEIPTIDKLKFANPGKESIEGSVDGNILIDLPAGKASTIDDRIADSGIDKVMSEGSVQVLPAFPGGAEAWSKFMQGYRYPQAAVENGISGMVYVSFVVEKDGSLTDIKVLRDPGYGMGEEALRLLKTSKKWKPGIQNGRPVRVQYTQPINLNIR